CRGSKWSSREKDKGAALLAAPFLILLGEGISYGQEALEIEIVSTPTPSASTASSVPIRKRNVTVCPARFGPRLIAVSMYPLLLELHLILPASGLFAVPSISPV